MRLVLPQGILTDIHAHAVQDHPLECTGYVSRCNVNGGLRAHRLLNSAPDKRANYMWSQLDQVAAFDEMYHEHRSLLAIYHSHTETDATPSGTDLQAAFYVGTYYLITTTVGEPETRAWYCRSIGELVEHDLVVV